MPIFLADSNKRGSVQRFPGKHVLGIVYHRAFEELRDSTYGELRIVGMVCFRGELGDDADVLVQVNPELLRIGDGPSMQVVRGIEVLVEFAVDVGAIDIHGNLVCWYSWVPYWLWLLGLHFGMLF